LLMNLKGFIKLLPNPEPTKLMTNCIALESTNIFMRYIVFVELNFFKTPETCEYEVSNINKLHFPFYFLLS